MPRIRKMDTHYRKALEPYMKLAITIRHLASGDKYPTLQYAFRVARNTICMIIPEVCQAIVDAYKGEVIPYPTTQDELRHIADEFQTKYFNTNKHTECRVAYTCMKNSYNVLRAR